MDVRPVAGMQFFAIEKIDVVEFHESDDGSGDPTQLHLILDIEGAPAPYIMRFKSRPAVDELIVSLITHSKRVWPD